MTVIRNHMNRKERNIFEVMKAKNCQPRTVYPVKIAFKNEGEIKTFADEEKLREFITIRLALKQTLQEVF